ncbi:NfeD family protein [Spirulina subsalsa]|uniref:NfeD family protein n=1 Tax=Spirulina subsalsa TaxID=54311 RepID=UPI0002F8ACC4|nr:NfeD family protein [Spirulina subsalsa]
MWNWAKQCFFSASTQPLGVHSSPSRHRKNRNHRHFCGPAIVEEMIHPHCRGRVRYRAGWWFALCEQETIISPGEVVEVVGIQNITLLVKPRSHV